MGNKDHLARLKEGVAAWNYWRFENPDLRPDLSSSDLCGSHIPVTDFSHVNFSNSELRNAEMQGAILDRANLSFANFHRAHLRGVQLVASVASQMKLTAANVGYADLSDADFRGADLLGADLEGAILARTDLSGAHFFGTNLTGAKLDETNFEGARVGHVIFANLDLRKAKGLETLKHLGPSTIGIDTIYRSAGEIPEVFLRGAGVPEPFIANMKSLVAAMSPIEFYSCFISHSSKDQELAERLHADLRSKNVRCWFAPEDLKIGDRLRPSFDEAIRVHDKLMVLLSEHSVRSEWVEKEVETAFEKERREKRTVLFPIRLDDAVMETDEAWAADIRRTRHIGDFREWKNHDAYKKALERLLRDLKAL